MNKLIGAFALAALVLNVSAALAQQKPNGQTCTQNADCQSSACYPGPGKDPNSYCVSNDANCALPHYDGAKYKSMVMIGATWMECRKPDNGKARFQSIQ